MKLEEIYKLIKGKIRDVEKAFSHELSHDVPIINELGSHITRTTGKMVRPALLCLSAKACGYSGREDVYLGMALELIHTATLVHDDVIDDADLRRGKDVVHNIYGTNLAILYGDYLYTLAMRRILQSSKNEIYHTVLNTTSKMIEGEIIQSNRNYSMDIDIPAYIELIERKTANLFATCSKVAGLLADVDQVMLGKLWEYGLNLGISFQIVDDYFDYTSNEKTIGKPVGSDLREGKITYPVLALFEKAGAEARTLVQNGFRRKEFTDSEMNELLAMMKEHRSLEETISKAREYADKAVACLDSLPESRARTAMKQLPVFVVERTK